MTLTFAKTYVLSYSFGLIWTQKSGFKLMLRLSAVLNSV